MGNAISLACIPWYHNDVSRLSLGSDGHIPSFQLLSVSQGHASELLLAGKKICSADGMLVKTVGDCGVNAPTSSACIPNVTDGGRSVATSCSNGQRCLFLYLRVRTDGVRFGGERLSKRWEGLAVLIAKLLDSINRLVD